MMDVFTSMRKMLPVSGVLSPAALVSHLRTPLYRNAYALLLTVVTTSGLGIVYWALAAHYYTAAAVGINSAAISGMMFVAGLAQRGLITVLTRFLPRAGRSTAKLVLYSYGVGVLTTLLVTPVFLLGISLWAPNLGSLTSDPVMIGWFLLASVAWCVFTLQDSTLTGLRQTHWVPVENTLYALVKLGLLVLLAQALPHYGVFASWTIPVALALIPVNLLLFLRLIPRHAAATKDNAEPIRPRQIAGYGVGNYVGGLFSLSVSTLLPVLVTARVGAAENAYFYLAWLVSTSMQLVGSNMTTSLTVEAAADQSKLRAYSRGVLLHMARLMVPAVLVVLVAAPYILHIFGKTYADEGSLLLRLLALSTLPGIINSLYLGVARVQKRIAGLIAVQAALSLLALIPSYFLLPVLGITAVGYVVLASQTLVAGVLAITGLRPIFARTSAPDRLTGVQRTSQ